MSGKCFIKNITSHNKGLILSILEVATIAYENRDVLTKFQVVHHHNNRNRKSFILPKLNFKIGRNSPVFLGIQVFNKLPGEIKICPNVITFKRALRKVFLEKC